MYVSRPRAPGLVQHGAQPREFGTQHLLGIGRLLFAPEPVDQGIRRDRIALGGDQGGQQQAQMTFGHLDREAFVGTESNRAQYIDSHAHECSSEGRSERGQRFQQDLPAGHPTLFSELVGWFTDENGDVARRAVDGSRSEGERPWRHRGTSMCDCSEYFSH